MLSVQTVLLMLQHALLAKPNSLFLQHAIVHPDQLKLRGTVLPVTLIALNVRAKFRLASLAIQL
jgi:hypothetical protein